MSALEIVNDREPRAVAAQAQPSMSASLVSVIERAAADPTIDLDRMERLLNMAQQARAEEAKREFFAAMARVQGEIEPVVRNRKNTHTKSLYADLAAIHAAAMPIITKHGFSLSFGQEPCETPNHIRQRCEVMHAAGHSVTYHGEYEKDRVGTNGNANKTGIQAQGSTSTYARRYQTCEIFNIATRDDNDGNAPRGQNDDERPRLSEDQLMELRDLIAAADTTEQAFCDHIKAERLADIYADNFQKACSILNQRIARRRA